ncbi:MAG TPA: hypothetical protein VF092_02595 [Longimicrobium sp.]
MTGFIRYAKRSLYVLPLLGALAFGAVQALAATPEPGDATTRSCIRTGCWVVCGETGGACIGETCYCY